MSLPSAPPSARRRSGVNLDPVFGDPTSETGYRTITFTLPSDGTYTHGVGVLDVGDEFLPSALLVDGASVQPAGPTPVPAPAAALLLGLGAITLLPRLRRQFLPA